TPLVTQREPASLVGCQRQAWVLRPDPPPVSVAVGSGDHHELPELVRASRQRPEHPQSVLLLDYRVLVRLARPAGMGPVVEHFPNRPPQPPGDVVQLHRPLLVLPPGLSLHFVRSSLSTSNSTGKPWS